MIKVKKSLVIDDKEEFKIGNHVKITLINNEVICGRLLEIKDETVIMLKDKDNNTISIKINEIAEITCNTVS